MKVYLRLIPLAIVPLFFSACVVSQSLGSISDSLGSVSTSLESISDSITSSSASSSGGDSSDGESAYRNDVRLFTAAYLGSRSAHPGFLNDLSRIAAEHGVSHWEGLPGTYIAIGAGLRTAGLGPESLERFQQLPATAQHLIRSGYNETL